VGTDRLALAALSLLAQSNEEGADRIAHSTYFFRREPTLSNHWSKQ